MLSKVDPNDIAFWYLFNNVIWIIALIDAGYLGTISRLFGYSATGNSLIGSTNLVGIYGKVDLWLITKNIYKKISLIVFIFLVVIGTFLIHKSISLTTNIVQSWIVWIVAILVIPFITYSNSFLAYLNGTNRIIEIRIWEFFFNFLNILFSIIILQNSSEISLLIFNLLFWLIVTSVRNFFLFKKYFYDDYETKSKKCDSFNINKEILSQGNKTLIGVVFSAGIFQLIGFYYSWKIKPIELSGYLFAFNLIWNIRNFSQAPFYDKIPQMTLLTANRKIGELQILARKYMVMTYASYTFFFLIILFFQKYILSRIDSKITSINSNLWILLGFGFLLERYGAMHLQVYTSSNKIISHKANVISGSLLIIFVILLVEPIGVFAFPVSLIVSYLLFYIWYSAKKSYDLLNTSFFNFEKFGFLPFIFIYILVFVYFNYFYSLL